MIQKIKKPQTQSERFKAAAKELGCDESEAAFEEKLRRIAKSSSLKKATKKKTPAK